MIPTKVVSPLPSTFIILGIIFTRLHSKFLQKNVYPSVQKFASPRERHLYDFFSRRSKSDNQSSKEVVVASILEAFLPHFRSQSNLRQLHFNLGRNHFGFK